MKYNHKNTVLFASLILVTSVFTVYIFIWPYLIGRHDCLVMKYCPFLQYVAQANLSYIFDDDNTHSDKTLPWKIDPYARFRDENVFWYIHNDLMNDDHDEMERVWLLFIAHRRVDNANVDWFVELSKKVLQDNSTGSSLPGMCIMPMLASKAGDDKWVVEQINDIFMGDTDEARAYIQYYTENGVKAKYILASITHRWDRTDPDIRYVRPRFR